MVKIVVFDLDGTLYDKHKHIDKDTVHKIIELEQKGIVVGIVTGRFYEELGEVIKILKLREYNGFVASSNGLEIAATGIQSQELVKLATTNRTNKSN